MYVPILAARGEVEAQGRGSLHPHILVWLLMLSQRELLDRLIREPESFRARLRSWMLVVVEAFLSVQQSSVQQMPLLAKGTDPQCGSADGLVAPLPLGPSEQWNYRADGGREMAKTEEAEIAPLTDLIVI